MKYLTLLLFTLLSINIFGQLSTDWDETYGGEFDDAANNIIELKDGNLLLIGYTESQGEGKKDGWLKKIDPKGESIWEMTYGGPKDDELFDAVEIHGGKIALAGTTESFGAGKEDMWLLVIDEIDGEEKWEKAYGGDKDDGAHKIVLGFDGKLVLAGYTKSRGAGKEDFYVIKINQDGVGKDQGKIIWKRNAGGKSSDFVGDIYQAKKDSAFYVLGTTNSYGKGQGDAWLLRIMDERGRIKGKKLYGWKKYEFGNAIVPEGNGFFIVGASMSNSAGLFDGWIARLNYEMESYFIRTYGGEKDDKFMSVIPDGKNYYAVGYTASKGEGSYDGWIVKVNRQGNVLWENTFGDINIDKFVKIIKLKSGSYIAVGQTNSKGEGKLDAWVVKFK